MIFNALAETINGLFKAEVIHQRGAWRSFDAVEELNGEKLALTGFFRMGKIIVGDRDYRIRRHGMGGAPGLEFWGRVEM